MDIQKILQSDALDILFEHRNKLYGAYELRKNYHKRIKRALILVIMLCMLASTLPIIAGLTGDKKNAALFYKPREYAIKDVRIKRQAPKVTKRESIKKVENQPSTKKFTDHKIERAELVVDILPKQTDTALSSTETYTTTSTSTTPSTFTAGKDTTGTTTAVAEPTKEIVIDEANVQEAPYFPGGEEELAKYLASHIKYPKQAVEQGISGRVIISFVVNKEGNISEVAVTRGIGYGCDEEAVRVVSAMPTWKAGRNNGRPVSVLFSLPITFELHDN